MIKKDLTKRQLEVFNFCKDFFERENQFPTRQNCADHFKINLNAINDHLKAIEYKGWLMRNINNTLKFVE